MGAKSIQRLRTKFIAVMLGAFFLTMLLIALLVNGAYVSLAQARMNSTLQSIIENNGQLPVIDVDNLAPSSGLGLRYFVVTLRADGTFEELRNDSDKSIDRQHAQELARKAVSSIFTSGSIDNYYYKVSDSPTADGRKVIAFMNGSVELGEGRQVMGYTLVFLGVGLLLAFVLVWFISMRAIRPEIEAARRQSEFITNASHELKTPLAVIRANTELSETIQGESEWSQSTLRQVDYLDGLVKNLVEFSRSNEVEGEGEGEAKELDVSAIVASAASPFESLAQSRDVTLDIAGAEGVHLVANEEKLRQLVRLLVDNAVKYCDGGGKVSVRAGQVRQIGIPYIRRQGVRIVVSNSYAKGKDVDYERLFERFYRGDKAHSNQGGYGIGLSVAQRICEEAEGSIKAMWKDGIVSFICLLY